MSITLSAPVGFGSTNRASDVEEVQAALKEVAHMLGDSRLDPGLVDGDCGVGTEGAIEQLQRRFGMLRPDVKVDPGGRTLRRLNALMDLRDTRFGYPFARSSEFAFHGPGAGMRAFGSRRSGGKRAHAGIDLYFPDFTDVLALADGVVTRGPYPFYLETFAVEVDHGSFLARYGEIAPERSWPVREGDNVERGQKVGRVGVLTNADGSRLGVASMMLHLEMYDKTESGKLTRAVGTSARSATGTPFLRRQDVIDPTAFVRAAAPSA
jgi:murein DD-endopeptidase MepM/ murein hydrolase activator NlpD